MEREENKGSLVSHPMRERSAAYRYRYCFGLGVLAMGNMRAIMELQPYYERLLRQLLPDQDQYAQIITDINNDLERHLELVRQTVEETMEFKEIHTTNASCTIACHCGPNTLGILFETE